MTSRRQFLLGAAALGLLPGRLLARPRFSAYPFALGVASGYPWHGGVTLWTRLIGLEERVAVPVKWEVATDEAMRHVVRRGEEVADPEWASSVHVDVQGLEADRWYWYRFSAGDAQSPVGRTRTAPAASARPTHLRFALASCQQYEHGFYNAYRHIVQDAPDLIAFLGDYIYESSWGDAHVRSHASPEPYTLEEYRARHALYRSDPDLQAAHAACPWVLVWDDHEVDNDYAGARPEDGMGPQRFLMRRAAAYRAYYEHLPLPRRMQPHGAHMHIHTQVGWGNLARLYLLDTRQHRTPQACPRAQRRGGANTVDAAKCEALETPGRSMLGAEQEEWLEEALARSRSHWNVLAQTTRMTRFDQRPGPERGVWTDGWDGYPASRERLLRTLMERKVRNPVVVGGDIHAFNVAQLKVDFDAPAAPVVASEFVTTSITSQGWPQERFDRLLPDNPHMLLADSRWRGYTRIELTPKRWHAELRALDSVKTRGSPCRTLASFAVEDGKPGPLKDL